MQGWVQITNLQLPREVSTPAPAAPSDSTVESTAKPVALEPPELVPVELLVVSRRSRDRAGLRFQRRGIDDEGNVANFVETEMIIRTEVGKELCKLTFGFQTLTDFATFL